MKFKGQGKINICGVEYKKNIADSRGGGGSEHPKKNLYPRLEPLDVFATVYCMILLIIWSKETVRLFIMNDNTRRGEVAEQSPNSVTVVWTRCLSLWDNHYQPIHNDLDFS